jgi:hypothetical protein
VQSASKHADVMFLMISLGFAVVIGLGICRQFFHFCNLSMVELSSRL